MKHNPDNPLWPGWKVTLLAAGLSFALIMAIAAITGGDDPEQAGRAAGYKYGWIIFAVPLLTYIVQKFRIDNWNRANPPQGPRDDSRRV